MQTSALAALAFVKERAVAGQLEARQEAQALLTKQGIGLAVFDKALALIKATAPIDVSFHPDRLDAAGELVVDSLSRTGRYTSQFETGISNGGVTAFKGGARDLWEQRLFGGAYQLPGVAAVARPKYGALNLLNYWDGACPRFGCCYFRLKPSVASRCTFAFGDSSSAPSAFGTIDCFDAVLMSALATIGSTGRALGMAFSSAESFLEGLARKPDSMSSIDFDAAPGRCLDECIEVHIHGTLNLSTDIEYLVADGSFQGTDVGSRLQALSEKYGFVIHWTPGFLLPTDRVPPDFRGPIMVPLAHHVAKDGVLDAVKIGQAAVSLRTHPDAWSEWGSLGETLQYLKQLWHVLATYGQTS